MRQELERIVRETIIRCLHEGLLKEAPVPDFVIEIPANPNHGHYATNAAMLLASSQRRSPREIASILLDRLEGASDLVDRVEMAGPGFINFWISDQEWFRALDRILEMGPDYGQSSAGRGQKVLVEFVSANPTGPLHLGHGRGAALGDTLCRIFSFCGYEVTREFYINDAGVQVRLLGESIYSRFRQKAEPSYPFPENGYRGPYVVELMEEISRVHPLGDMDPEEAIRLCSEEGRKRMMEEIRADLSRFRVSFDRWQSEREMVERGVLNGVLGQLEGQGLVYERDGALWIRTRDFGDDKDRVIRKSDGHYTYFATDLGYHLDKWRRGYDLAINIWGADHHGYIPRIRAGLKAQGAQESWLRVLLIQLVKLWRGGQEVKMSKRAGDFVTLRELMDEVGVDPIRFVFLTKSHDSPLDVDVDLVKRKDPDNPVFYVQYAHARICSVFRKAGEQKGTGELARPSSAPLALEEEKALIRKLVEFPRLLEEICRSLEAHRLPYYLTDLAGSFHRYFNLGNARAECRIVHPNQDIARARLRLAEAVRRVLSKGLELLGTEAPESM